MILFFRSFYYNFKWHAHYRLRFSIRVLRHNLLGITHRVEGKLRPWVHQVCDGRGLRDVYVDGVKIECATYANTRTGEVRYNGKEPQLTPDKQSVLEHTTHGKVEIKWLEPSSLV